MGYTTYFEGAVTVTPPLNEQEIDYLSRFSGSRRMHRGNGPYYAERLGSSSRTCRVVTVREGRS